MNLENPSKKQTESSHIINTENKQFEDESTALIQEQKSWKSFDKNNIGENNKRLPASPEQIKKMDQMLNELGSLFDGFDRWHLDGALNISLLKKEYIGNHKDIDLSVERNDLKDLELFLEKKAYGLFLSQKENDDNEKANDNRKKVMRRVSHIGLENYQGHPMICALDEKGKIDDSKDLNYIDLHIINRDDKNLPLLTSGVNCPEAWTKSYPINKDGQKINLSHPAKVLYYKLNQGRDYDNTDVDQLLELELIKESNIDEIKNIYEEEFIKKRELIVSICDKITQQIQPEMKKEEIFKRIKELEEFKNKEEMDGLLKTFSNELFKLKDKSLESVSDLAITMLDVEGKNQEKISKLESIRQTVRDKKDLKNLRNEFTEKIKTGEKVFNFLNKVGFNEIKKTDEKFDEWIKKLSYDDFLGHLTRLNGIVRETSTNKRFIDGENVEVTLGAGGVAYLPPEQEKKDELMKEGFNAFKDLKNNDDRAKLMYYIIQAIHPYSDGNGRLGRLLYEIINNNELNKDTLSKLLDHNKKDNSGTGEGRDVFSEKLLSPNKAYYLINRELVKDYLSKDFLEKYGGINTMLDAPAGYGFLPNEVKDTLSKEEVTLAEKILGEEDPFTFSFRDIALSKLIIEDDFLKKYIKKSEDKIEKGKNFAISMDFGKDVFNIDPEIMDSLNEKHVRRLIEIHKELKEKFIRTLIDIFKNSKKHKEIDSDGREYLIKDLLDINKN